MPRRVTETAETAERIYGFSINSSLTCAAEQRPAFTLLTFFIDPAFPAAQDKHRLFCRERGDTSLLLTIGELVENLYFPDVEKSLRPTSLASYKFLWNRHLKPRIGRLVVRTFERKDAHQLWQRIHDENPHLRNRSISQIRTIVNAIFKWALDRGLYHGDNPAKASLPSGLPANKKTEADDVEEIAAMLKASIDPKLSAVLALLFAVGERRSEARGACWEDYRRLKTGAVLHIHRQYNRYGWQPLKNGEKGIADIEIGEEFAVHIDRYRASLPAGADSGLMFPGRKPDRPMDFVTYANIHIKPLLKPLGIRWTGFHTFRRGNSTFVAKHLNSEAAAAFSRHTVEVAEQNYIKQNDQERRAAQVAKVASIESKRASMRKAAAGPLNDGLVNIQ